MHRTLSKKSKHTKPTTPSSQTTFTTCWVDTLAHTQEACTTLRQHKLLAFDMEGYQLGRHGVISLVQLASRDTVYLFDIMTLGTAAFSTGGLAALLEDDTILKLCYDCRCDAEALHHLHSVSLAGAYDLQIAYTLLYQAYNDPFLKGLHRALQAPGVLPLGSGRQKILQTKLDGKRRLHDMLVRPLPKCVLDYCTLDVIHLFTMYDLWMPHLKSVCVHEFTQQRIRRFLCRQNMTWCMSRLDFGMFAIS